MTCYYPVKFLTAYLTTHICPFFFTDIDLHRDKWIEYLICFLSAGFTIERLHLFLPYNNLTVILLSFNSFSNIASISLASNRFSDLTQT